MCQTLSLTLEIKSIPGLVPARIEGSRARADRLRIGHLKRVLTCRNLRKKTTEGLIETKTENRAGVSLLLLFFFVPCCVSQQLTLVELAAGPFEEAHALRVKGPTGAGRERSGEEHPRQSQGPKAGERPA